MVDSTQSYTFEQIRAYGNLRASIAWLEQTENDPTISPIRRLANITSLTESLQEYERLVRTEEQRSLMLSTEEIGRVKRETKLKTEHYETRCEIERERAREQ